MSSNKLSYGVSSRYLGKEGVEYFARRNTHLGTTLGMVEARKFQKFIHAEDTVLDFGCGGGFILKSLHCLRRIGVEVNPVAKDVALANGVMDCYSSLDEVSDCVADVAISNHALEHVPSP